VTAPRFFGCGWNNTQLCHISSHLGKRIAKQARRYNRFNGGRMFEFGLAIDVRWGTGTAVFLEKLSRQIERWTTDELGTLADGGRRDGECTTLFTKNLDHNFLA
jgi:hypothetical protein